MGSVAEPSHVRLPNYTHESAPHGFRNGGPYPDHEALAASPVLGRNTACGRAHTPTQADGSAYKVNAASSCLTNASASRTSFS